MEHEKANVPEKKCKVAFCNGPENCLVKGMIKDAPDISDLNNTFTTIAPECRLANNPKLIKLYNQRLTELQVKDSDSKTT